MACTTSPAPLRTVALFAIGFNYEPLINYTTFIAFKVAASLAAIAHLHYNLCLDHSLSVLVHSISIASRRVPFFRHQSRIDLAVTDFG